LWACQTNKCYQKERADSEGKFNKLKKGYNYQDNHGNVTFVLLDELIGRIPECLVESEWGFPKGRRNFLESDKNCAVREFREETGIKSNRIRIKYDKPVDEVFTGTNHMRYKHVYYIAEYIPNEQYQPAKFQESEIKRVEWFPYKDAQHKLQSSNIEKRELLKRVNNIILRKQASRF